MEKEHYERRLNKLYNLVKKSESKEKAYRLKDFEDIKNYVLSMLLKSNQIFIRCENYPQDFILDRLNLVIFGGDIDLNEMDRLNEYTYARRHILSTLARSEQIIIGYVDQYGQARCI